MPNILARSQNKTELLYASVGCVLVRYALGVEGDMHEKDRLRMPFKVQYACFDAELGLAYVACSDGGVGNSGNHHCLVVVALESFSIWKATPIDLPYRPIHVALDKARRRLLTAYNLPAAITIHALDENGRTQECYSFLSSPDVGWFPHHVLPVPGSAKALVTCRGNDASGDQPENPGSLQLVQSEAGEIKVVQIVAPNRGYGFGPRNSAYHPFSPWLYTVLERQNAFAVFDIYNGKIAATPKTIVTTLERPLGVRQPQLAGALELHPNGRFAYVVNRSHAVTKDGDHIVWAGGENSIAVFSLNDSTGVPVLVQIIELPGLHARCISILHGGKTLIAAIRQPSWRKTNKAVEECSAGFSIFRIADDGHLSEIGFHAVDVGSSHLFWAGC